MMKAESFLILKERQVEKKERLQVVFFFFQS